LVHIETITTTAVASLSVNDIFTAEYTFYKIFLKMESSAASATLNFRYRVGGTDATSAEYDYRNLGSGAQTSNQTSIALTSIFSGVKGLVESTVGFPFEAERNYLTSTTNLGDGGSLTGARYRPAISYTGFTLFPSTGNIIGSVTIMGFKQ
jgi:hypothetical protein